MHKAKQVGATLTEVLIALVLLAILAVAITPNYETYLEQNNLRSAAEKLYSDVVFARTTAISLNQPVRIRFNVGSTWCYGITNSNLSNCNCNSADPAANCNLGNIQSTEFPNTSAADTGFLAHAITFESVHGMLQDSPGSITFTASSGANITVSINKLGAPSICSSTVGGYVGC